VIPTIPIIPNTVLLCTFISAGEIVLCGSAFVYVIPRRRGIENRIAFFLSVELVRLARFKSLCISVVSMARYCICVMCSVIR